MAPVETTDAATVDQRCTFKHQTGWRHNHSNSKLCVALRMGQANLLSTTNCHLCAGAMLSSRSIFQATRFVRVILEQEPSHEFFTGEKNDLNLCVSSLCKPYLCIVKKKNYPSPDLECHSCARAIQQYPESHHLCAGGHATMSRRRNSVILAGAMRQCPAEDEASGSSRRSHLQTSTGGFHRFAPREHHGRSFWRETWR